MKALEILYKLDTEYKYAQLNSDSCVRSQFINEAIKEHEELNNRSCDGCKKQDTFMCPVTSFDKNMEDFCCNRYKTKDNK